MNKHEKLLYQENIISKNFVMLFVILNTAHAIFTLVNMNVDYKLGIYILSTIFVTMLGFLAAVKVQTYSLNWSYGCLGIAAIQGIRLIIMPSEIVGTLRTRLIVIMLIAIGALITGGVTSIMRTNIRTNYSHKIKNLNT